MITIDFHKDLKGKSGSFELVVKESIQPGKIIGLFGDSGAGKTTMLRILACLDKPTKGTVTFTDSFKELGNGKPLTGFMFQDYSLFPNMTVRQNLNFALSKEKSHLVQEMIELLDLDLLSNSLPSALSGGQQQRVAFGRALLVQTNLFLLDEPFSALDIAIKEKLIQYLKTRVEKENITIFISSHNLMDLNQLSAEIWEIKNGIVKVNKNLLEDTTSIQQQGVIEKIEKDTLYISSSGQLFELDVKNVSNYEVGQVVFLFARDINVRAI